MIFGIDTSDTAGNGAPSWPQARDGGPIGFAIIRACYGDQPDTAFARNWPQIKAAGLVRGAFLFLRFPSDGQSVPDPAAQASALIATVGALDTQDLPPTIDLEFPGKGRSDTGLSAAACLDQVRACWDALHGHYGVAPLIYTSARIWSEDLDDLPTPDLDESPLWAVRWIVEQNQPAIRSAATFAGGRWDPVIPPPWGDAWWIQQFQGEAVDFPGLAGRVDVDRFNPLARGGRGDRVAWVQRRLAVPATGTFDAATDAAIRDLQAASGLVVDGVIGPRTFARLCWIAPT